jgi:hypothetical protein
MFTPPRRALKISHENRASPGKPPVIAAILDGVLQNGDFILKD